MRSRIVEWLNQIFNSNIFTYLVPNFTIMSVLTFFVVLFLFIRRVEKENLDKETALAIYFWILIGILVGGKLYGLIQVWLQEEGRFSIDLFRPSRIGMVSMGNVLGGLMACFCYNSIKKKPVLCYLDVIAPFIGIAIFVMRIGCFLNGCCYGDLCFLSWAVQYPPGSYPFEDQVAISIIKPSSNLSLPVHPLQLYMATKGLAIFGLLSWTRGFKLNPGGQFFLFLLAYFSLRFILEFFRGDLWHPYIGPLTHIQFFDLILIPVVLIFWYFLNKRQNLKSFSIF